MPDQLRGFFVDRGSFLVKLFEDDVSFLDIVDVSHLNTANN